MPVGGKEKRMTTKEMDRSLRNGLCRVGGYALIAMLTVTIIQILILVIWPPPGTVAGLFDLFNSNWFLGLLSMDLLYILNNTLLILVYLGLFAALYDDSPAASLIGLVFGVTAIAAYYGSNTSFEMLTLSRQYSAAATEAQQIIPLAAGQAMLEAYRGTGFDAYYVLSAITLLVFAWVMHRGAVFSRTATLWVLAAGILMIIPSTAGTVGLVFSLFSLLPWMVFCVLGARTLLSQGKS